MNSYSTSLKIIWKIWLTALFMNTLFGTAVLTDMYTYADMIGVTALLGFFYAAVFTLPFVCLLCLFLRFFLKMELCGNKLFAYFFFTGLVLTMACFTIFFVMIGTMSFPIWSLLLIAMGSGAVSMLLEYKPILQLRRDEEERLYNSFLD